jgi:hypothetical protein
MSKFCVDSPVTNAPLSSLTDMYPAVGNRNSMSLHRPKPIA